MKIFVYDLPARFNTEIVERHPELARDFWFVEHVMHRNLAASRWRVDDPEEADFRLVPYYSMCDFAAFSYRFGFSLAKPGRLQRRCAEIFVAWRFSNVLKWLGKQPSWNDRAGGRGHVMVFGQGRGANQGGIWKRHRQSIEACNFWGVEAHPFGDASAFNREKDLVIPGYSPWVSVIDEVREEPIARDLLIHFRGRSWGSIRWQIFDALQSSDDILVSSERSYRLGGEGGAVACDDAQRYFREMRRCRFSLCPSGWTPWTQRFYESVLVGCIPVLIPGTFVLPFDKLIDHRRYTITVSEEEIPHLEEILRDVTDERVNEMLGALEELRRHFIYNEVPESGDAVDMTITSLKQKVAAGER